MRLLRALLLPPLVIAILVGVVLIGRSGWQATAAVRDLQAAAAAAAQLREALTAGDVEAAEQHIATVRAASREAAERLEGPSWRLTERLPGIGDDIAAVRQSSQLVLRATRRLGDPLLEVARLVGPADLRPVDGRVDLATLEEAQGMLATSAQELAMLSETAAGIDLAEVVPEIRASVSGLQLTLALAANLVEEVEIATDVLPAGLGEDRLRRYLVLLVDSGVATPGGGAPVAYAVVEAEGGGLAVVDEGDIADLAPAPPLDLDAEAAFLAGRPRKDGIDGIPGAGGAFATPDFSRTGAYVRRAWREARPDLPIDGVASVDAVALAEVAVVVGAEPAMVEAADGSDLGDVLRRVVAGDGDSGALLEVMRGDALSARLHFWAADQAVQRRLAGSRLAGIPMGTLDGLPRLGVYLTSDVVDGPDGATAGSTLLRLASARVRPLTCGADGQQMVLSAVVAPAGPVDAVTDAAAGPADASLLLLGPSGGILSRDVSVEGGELRGVRARTVGDRPALRVALTVDPGGAAVVRTQAATAHGETDEPRVAVPAADPATRVRVDAAPCPQDAVPGP